MAGLKRRTVVTGETRKDHAKKWLDCQFVSRCGESVLVDARTDTVTCGGCIQRNLLAPDKKKRKKTPE